jgi:hypothetical protein
MRLAIKHSTNSDRVKKNAQEDSQTEGRQKGMESVSDALMRVKI